MLKSGNERIHIMFGVWDLSDGYNQHIGVVITSAAVHASLPLTVHLLYDETLNQDNPEYENNKHRYSRLEEKYDLNIIYHHFTLPEYLYQSRGLHNWSPAAFLRLFSPILLPDIDRVIYLDGDVIVNLDLAEILSQKWWDENYALGACLTPEFPNTKFYRKLIATQKSMGVPLDHYFNSGVLFLNLKKIRSEYNLPKSTEEILKQHPTLLYPDQDILNIVFHDDVCILPNIYNNNAFLEPENDFKHTIIHYIGVGKPWRDIGYTAAWEYWKYLAESPWGDTWDDYMRSVQRLIARSPLEEIILTGVIRPRKCIINTIHRLNMEIHGFKKIKW